MKNELLRLFLILTIVIVGFIGSQTAFAQSPPDPPKQFSGDVIVTHGVDMSWLQAQLNGDTHNDFTIQRLNLDGVTWDDLTTTTDTTYLDNQPQQNETAMYRIRDNGGLGFSCYQPLLNSTIVDELLSHFPFCNTINDNGILNNNAIVTGTEQYATIDGLEYFDFDGATDVDLGDTDYDFERTDPFSLVFEINGTAQNNINLISKRDTNLAVGYSVWVQTNNLNFDMDGATTELRTRSNSPPLGTGSPVHVVITYDGSSDVSGVNFYYDGEIESDSDISNTLSETILNNKNFTIGAESDGGQVFTGQIRDFMIINKTLDANEVEQLYQERIDTSNLALKPHAVTDLTATATSFSSVGLDFTLPFTFGGCDFLQVNYTTPEGDPLTILTSSGACTNSYEVTGVPVGSVTSFRVSTVNDFGKNGSGNIANTTILSDYDIGSLEIDSGSNPNIFDVLFTQTDLNSTSVQVDVRYPNVVTNFTCNIAFKYANTDQDYYNLDSSVYDSNFNQSSFVFHNADNEVIDFYCQDVDNSTINGAFTKPQVGFPFKQQVDDFRAGTFGLSSDFGGMDIITLLVVIVSMVGFNRTNPAVGVIISVMMLGATSFLGIITLPTTVISGLVLAVILAIVVTRKD